MQEVIIPSTSRARLLNEKLECGRSILSSPFSYKVRPWTLSSAIRGPNLNLSPFALVLSPSPTRFPNFILCFVYFIYHGEFFPHFLFRSLSLSSVFPLFLTFFFLATNTQSHGGFHLQLDSPPFARRPCETRTASLILYKQNTFARWFFFLKHSLLKNI